MKRNNFKCFKVCKAPNRNEKQNSTAKSRARRLYENHLHGKKCCLILDDETYVKKAFKQMPGARYYVSKVRNKVPRKFRQVLVDKFSPKLMIWQAICACGKRSRPYICNGTMKSAEYISSLKMNLIPLIRDHGFTPTLFWPDLASIHYAKDTLSFYQANDINFVPKQDNPPNSPELRPIERFWAIIKSYLKTSGKVVTTPQQMILQWNNATKYYGESLVTRLMSNIKMKVVKFYRNTEN